MLFCLLLFILFLLLGVYLLNVLSVVAAIVMAVGKTARTTIMVHQAERRLFINRQMVLGTTHVMVVLVLLTLVPGLHLAIQAVLRVIAAAQEMGAVGVAIVESVRCA